MVNCSAIRPQSLTGRVLRYPLRLIPAGLALPVLQGPLRGKRWIVGAHLHGCWLGSYEWALQRRIAEEIESGSVFFDIGANVGFYSLLAALRAGPAGRVYAFEPLPANISLLRKHLELNRIANVEVFEMALSDYSGTESFVSEASRAMGKLAPEGDLTVETTTLDALLASGRIAPPHAIKMDIEGSEARALAGGETCFRRYRPKLFLATHGDVVRDQCCRLLASWDYQWTYLAREGDERAELFARPSNR